MLKVILYFKNVMTGIFLLLSFVEIAQSNQEHDLIYTVKYLGGDKANCFDISAEIKGNQEGKILIKVPRYVGNFTFNTKKGGISYTKPEDFTFLISLEPQVNLEANYQACIINQYRANYRPLIEQDFFHFMSDSLFVLPSTNLEEIKTVKYQFINFPDDYSIVTNHILNKRQYEIKDSVGNISHSIIAGGKFDIKTVTIKNKPVHIIINGKWSMITADEISNYVQKLIYLQRKLMGDYNFPHFVVIIFDDIVPEGGGGLSGSLYENVLSMVFTDTELKYKYLLLGSLSHELFHAWIGNKIKIATPQGDLQWFFEGMNDFYGWQIALKTGQVTIQDYIKYYNKLIKEYALSPYKEASNDEIAKIFKPGNPAGQLAMVRGHIVFMEILNKLHSQKKSRKLLDAALFEISDKYSGSKKYVSKKELDEIFRKHLGDKIWNDAASIINAGTAIQLSSSQFLGKVTLQNTEVSAPSFGFDLKTLVGEKQIRLLSKKSKAFQGGLTENSKVIEYGIDLTDPNRLVIILAEGSDNKQKLIKFTPDQIKKIIPQYE